MQKSGAPSGALVVSGGSVENKVILVAGASAGIGFAAAEQLARRGHTVYAASRRGVAPPGCEPLVMDVDSDDSVAAAVRAVLDRSGGIDALVHCAGWGLAGAIEDTPGAEALAQFQTNFFGAHRVCRALLPALRARRGQIVLISSVTARVPIPYQAMYAASKAALSSYAEALRFELKPYGVRVSCVEPGNFRTDFTGSRRRACGWTDASPYARACADSVAWMEADERRAPPPQAVATRIQAILDERRPAFMHVVVAHAFERIGAWLRNLLPQRIYEAVAARVFRVA